VSFCCRIKLFIPISNDNLLELDRNGRKFELCIEQSEPVLNIADLKQFLPCTCNLDPYLTKLIRGIRFLKKTKLVFTEYFYCIESAAYFYMNNTDENGFINNDPSRFFPHHDSKYVKVEMKKLNRSLSLDYLVQKFLSLSL
jgi:hypothetical protein